MSFKGRKWLLGSIVMVALQMGALVAVHAQSGHQAKNGKTGLEVCHLAVDGSVRFELKVVGQADRSSHLAHGDVPAKNGVCPDALSMFGSDRSAELAKSQGPNRTNRAGATGSTDNASSVQAATAGAKPADDGKTFALCHKEGDGAFQLNTVSESAVGAHLAHGDMYSEAGACLDGGSTGGGPAPGANPEPITMLLFGAGLAGIGYAARRRLGTRSQEE